MLLKRLHHCVIGSSSLKLNLHPDNALLWLKQVIVSNSDNMIISDTK